MKKSLYLSLFAIGALTAAEPPNLVLNPDFTQMRADTPMPKVWNTNVRKGPGGTPPVEFKVVKGVDDDAGIAILSAEPNRTSAIAEVYQTVSVKPDREYYFSIFLKEVRSGSSPGAYVEFKDANRKQIGFARVRPAEGAPAVSGAYRLYESSFKTLPEQRFVNLSLRLGNLGAGEVHFDKATLIELQ